MSDAVHSSFGLDPAIAAQLRDLGPELDAAVIAATRALFLDRFDLGMPAGGVRHYDVAYGDHPRQKMDLCGTQGHGRPVVLFVPGGGFTGGDKSAYLHVPTFFAREGFLGIVMNYRLAPDHVWPAGARDVAAVLDWIADHAADCGGDPSAVFVVAQSAGAAHAAGALFDARCAPRSLDAVRAAVLMSGLYEVGPVPAGPGVAAYFGADPARYADRSPSSAVDGSAMPVIVASAEWDPPAFRAQAALLADRLAATGRAPRTWRLDAHNHVSPVVGLGCRGDRLGAALAAEFRGFL